MTTATSGHDTITIRNIQANCLIGELPWERKQRQRISCNLTIMFDTTKAAASDKIEDTIDYVRIARHAVDILQGTSFHLLETLANYLATELLSNFPLLQVNISINKSAHFPEAEQVSITITRP